MKQLIFLLSFLSILVSGSCQSIDVVSYVADPHDPGLEFYWYDGNGWYIGSLGNMKAIARQLHKQLVFAMNGGMYKADHTLSTGVEKADNMPQGLYIQDGEELTPIDTSRGKGNFYMQPNGIFYLTKSGKGVVSTTKDFRNNGQVKYATQSGPMLIVDGNINSLFKEGSENLNIRNGVGILPDGNVLFAMSKGKVNFYDFAKYFKDKGCNNALYLDGFVSRTYLPEAKWEQLDGDFGVIIAVMK